MVFIVLCSHRMHDIFRCNTWGVLYAFHQRLPEIMNHIPTATNHGLLVMNKSRVIHQAWLFLVQGNMYSCQILALPVCIRKSFTERIHMFTSYRFGQIYFMPYHC